MTILFKLAAATAVVIGGAALSIGATATAAPAPGFTCSGTPTAPGTIPAGTYQILSIPGGSACLVSGPGSVVALSPVTLGNGSALAILGGGLTVRGSITVGPQAVFVAPTNSAPVSISGPVVVQSNGAFVLGTETPMGPLFASISGGVTATGASSVQIHNTTIYGSVTLSGGGSDNPLLDALAAQAGAPPGPNNFNDLEDNVIQGGVTETGYGGVWAGVLRDTIRGPLTFSNNTQAQPDEYDIGSLVVYGPAVCSDNSPAPNMGHSPGAPSVVHGPTVGNQAATCTGVPSGG